MDKIRRGILFVVYLAFWLLCFEVMRLFFLVFNIAGDFSCTSTEFFGSLYHGLPLDLASMAYIGIFVLPFFILFSFVKSQRAFRIFMDVLTAVMIVVVCLVVVGDAEVYRSWQFRIDASVLSYLKNPDLMFASVSTWRIIMLFVLVALLAVAMFFLYRVMTRRLFRSLVSERMYSLLLLLFAGLLVIPARGGIGIVPLNTGVVYFCDNSFANHSAINVCWNFGASLISGEEDFDRYMFFDGDFEIPIDTTKNEFYGKRLLKKQPEQIVFVLLESFTWRAMCYDKPEESVTPKLLTWRDKGIFFSNFYASGDRSVRGIASIFSGVPSLPDYSVMKKPEKTQQMPSLLRALRESGYENQSFYYGGDVNFANMNSYLCLSGVNNIVSQNNLQLDCRKTKWGYDDECMFSAFYDYLQQNDSKSVSVLFTLNSHEPFDVPLTPYGTDDELARSMNAYYYTDSCLNDFLCRMQKSPQWDNTLIILVSDHGKLFRSQNWASLDKSHIVMQWLGGVVDSPFDCSVPCDQADISSTLLSALGRSYDDFTFSENIFGTVRPTAFSPCGRGFSYIEGDTGLWYESESDSFKPKDADTELQRRAKLYCQKVAQYYAGLINFAKN